MKKLSALILAVALLLSLAACGSATARESYPELPVPEAEWTEGDYPDVSQYAADLDGLCAFMEDGGAVAAGEGYPVDTAYEVIGAAAGKRYRFTFNGATVQAEFYEFDPENLSSEAQAILADAQVQGQGTILRNTVPAWAAEDNRFLMIYIDAKKDDANQAHRDMAASCFSHFCVNQQ